MHKIESGKEKEGANGRSTPKKPAPAPQPPAASLQQVLGNRAVAQLGVQRKMTLNAVGDKYEQEADAVASQVVRQLNAPQPTQRQATEEEEPVAAQRQISVMRQEAAPEEEEALPTAAMAQRQEAEEEEAMAQRQEADEEEVMAQRQEADKEEVVGKTADLRAGGPVDDQVASRISQAQGGGAAMSDAVRQPMEQAFGHDFSGVRIHTNGEANQLNQSLQARAFTTGQDIFFRQGEYNPTHTAGQELLAHELTHVVQQTQSTLKRHEDASLQRNTLVFDPIKITGDPNFYKKALRNNKRFAQNLVHTGWPYEKALQSLWENEKFDEFADAVRNIQETRLGLSGKNVDGILGPNTTRLLNQVQSGDETAVQQSEPETNQWSKEEKMAYVMDLLVNKYNFPENGAAGLVGNLYAESKIIPNRIEGSKHTSPMTARNAQGKKKTFTAEEVMNRQYKVKGPEKTGIGLAQWTAPKRREGLFKHEYEGNVLGTDILTNLDAQVDYLVKELESKFKGVNKVLQDPKSSVEDASDEVLFNFERPGKVLRNKTDKKNNIIYKTRKNKAGKTVFKLDGNGKKIPYKILRRRTDPAAQPVMYERRKNGNDALDAFKSANSS